jgi:hypothetical protein
VFKGCVRQFFAVDGTKKTANFFTPGLLVISMKSLSEGVQSDHFIECCTDVELVTGIRNKRTYTDDFHGCKPFPGG